MKKVSIVTLKILLIMIPSIGLGIILENVLMPFSEGNGVLVVLKFSAFTILGLVPILLPRWFFMKEGWELGLKHSYKLSQLGMCGKSKAFFAIH